MGAKVTKGQAVRKAKRNVAGFDAALERTRLTGQTAAQREELADELATLAAKLQDNRTTLLSLLATAGEGTADGRELVASKTSLDERIVQHATFAEAHAKRAKPVTSSLDPEEQSIVDTLAWLIGATSKLRAQLSRSESTIESALSSVSQAKSVAEEAKRMEIFNELLGRNEDRQWHVERLEQVESRFTANELSVEQILGVKDAVDKFIKYNESAGFKTDRSIYFSLGLDLKASQDAAKPSHGVAYIHDSDDDAGYKPNVYDRISIADLVAPSSAIAPREDDGWEVVEKKLRVQKEHGPSSFELPEDRAMREQREQAGRMPPKVYTAYDNEMPVSERPRNYRTVTCREWLVRGTCSFGGACTYLHGIPETPSSAVDLRLVGADENPFYRTRVCRRWQSGHCPDGDNDCRYLHSNNPQDRQQPSSHKAAPAVAPQLDGADEEELSPRVLAGRAKKPCKWHASSSGCEHGQDCHFQHAEQPEPCPALSANLDEQTKTATYKERLRSKFKTVLCDKFDTPSGCPYKLACQYAHGAAELVGPGFSPQVSPKVEHASPSPAFDLHPADFPGLSVASAIQKPQAPKASTIKGKTGKTAPVHVAAAAMPVAAAVAIPIETPITPDQTLLREKPSTPASAVGLSEQMPTSGPDPAAAPPSREYYAASRSTRAEQSLQTLAASALVADASAAPVVVAPQLAATPALPSTSQPAASIPPPVTQPVSVAPAAKVAAKKKLIASLPASPAAPAPAAPAPRPFRLLPLGKNACYNALLMGSCLNGSACLARHAINTDDHAAGVKPLLGNGACLNFFIAGSCANGTSCLARHALTEDDYVQQAAVETAAAAAAPTPAPIAAIQPPTQHAPAGRSFAENGTDHDFRAIARPVSRTGPVPAVFVAAPAAPAAAATTAHAVVSDYPDHLSRAVADLVISDDEEDEVDTVEAVFDVSDSDGE